MLDDFDAMFSSCNAAPAPSGSNGITSTTRSHLETAPFRFTTNSLPQQSEIGASVFKMMRKSGHSEHRFVALDVHQTKDSATITALMTEAPPNCMDTSLLNGFGCLQATAPEFRPNSIGSEYESGQDKHLFGDGSPRIINKMLNKDKVVGYLDAESTPAAFKSAFANAAVAPQGDELIAQVGPPILRFHINPGKKRFPKKGDVFKVTNFVLPAALPKEDGGNYLGGGACGMLPWHIMSRWATVFAR